MSEELRWPDTVGPGSLVAGYRIKSQLGVGGMAVVFRAKDERLGRMVALKVMAPQWAGHPQFRQRFIAESRAVAAVDDPHVIPIYEAGEADGFLFIAMRLVDGPDLGAIIHRDGPMPPARALDLLSPVASALDSAHDARLVHRDVKPANILVHERPGRQEHVYLSDFGVSKSAASGAVSLTGTGQYIGTPHYSSPEQCRGQEVDGRTDQYALACVAYQLFTGHFLFERDDRMAILLAHMTEPPPSLTRRRPDLPAAVNPVMAKALAKAPGDRYPTCQDFTDALRSTLRLPSPYGPRRRRTRHGRVALGPGHMRDRAPLPAPGRPSITAKILCTVSSLSLIYSATSAILGYPPFHSYSDLPLWATLGNGVWSIGDILLIVGTILMWGRASIGRILAIIGLSMVMAGMLSFQLEALSAYGSIVVMWWAYPIYVFLVLSLAFVLLPGTGRNVKVGIHRHTRRALLHQRAR